MKLILGSSSPNRKELLEKAGLSFTVMTAYLDEQAIRSDDYELLPLLLARAKADKLLQQIKTPAILITSDQIVVCKGELREKPQSRDQAIYYLNSYSKFPAQTNTAVVVTNTENGMRIEELDIVRTYFKPIPSKLIEQIVDKGKVFNAAGGFMIQDPLLVPYIDRIEGGKEDSVIGIPVEITKKLIHQVSKINRSL